MHPRKDKQHKHQCMASFLQRRKTWTSGRTRSAGKCRSLKMKQSCDLETESVTEGRPEYCSIESRSERVRGLNDEIMNEMMITKFGDNCPSNTVKRAVSAASTLDCRYRRNNNMITDEIAVSLSDVSFVSDQPTTLHETRSAAAVSLSIQNLTINNSSGVDIGCVVNKSFSNDSKPTNVDADIPALNCNQGALTYDTRKEEVSSSNEYTNDPYLQNVIESPT